MGRGKRRPNGPEEPSPGLNEVMPWNRRVGEDSGLKGRENVARCTALAPFQGAAFV